MARKPEPQGSLDILRAMADPKLFGRWFADETWAAWRTFLAAVFGLVVQNKKLFRLATGRSKPLTAAAKEAWLIVGRRAGKSHIAALIAVFLACFRDYRRYLSPGERGVVMVLACDRGQAQVIFRYVRALLTEVPMLARLIESETQERIELTNGIAIEVHTASYRSVRGHTLVAAICDEIAFWRSDDSANPDTEVLNALRPAMATVPNSLLLCLSSPYARRGELFRTFEKHYAQDDSNVFVWRAATRTMNPRISEQTIKDAYDSDPAAAATEWDAEFRSDLSAAFEAEWIDAAIERGVIARPPTHAPGRPSLFDYRAFVDPAGGSGGDSYTAGIAHVENRITVVDAVLEIRPPFNTEHATDQVAALLKPYGVRAVTGDKYAGSWPADALKKHDIGYMPSERTKSEIYLETISMFSTGRVRLPDNPRLANQLRQLERRTGRGRDIVDHPPRAHDDIANAACGALLLASRLPTSKEDQQTVITELKVVLDHPDAAELYRMLHNLNGGLF